MVVFERRRVAVKTAIALGLMIVAFATCLYAGQSGFSKGSFETTDFVTPKMAVHIEAHATWSCSKGPTLTSFGDLVRRYNAETDIDAFVVVFDYTEFQGLEYSMSWPASWSSTVFTQCADLVIGGITDPNDGISQAWFTCQEVGTEGDFFVAGWAWLSPSLGGYEEGQVAIVGHPQHDRIYAAECGQNPPFFDAESVYYAGYKTEPDSVPTTPTTWGEVKALFH
jgi:hypothetical protein